MNKHKMYVRLVSLKRGKTVEVCHNTTHHNFNYSSSGNRNGHVKFSESERLDI